MNTEKQIVYSVLRDREWHTSNELRNAGTTHAHRGVKELEANGYTVERTWAKKLYTAYPGNDVMCYRIVAGPDDAKMQHARSHRRVEQVKAKQLSLV